MSSFRAILSPQVAVCICSSSDVFLSYRNAVNVEILSRVAVITSNLDHSIHLHHKVIVMFDLATVKIIERLSSLDAEYTFHFGAFVDRLGGSVYGQRCESKASRVIVLCY
jgi:hypothetical protein